MPRTKRLAAVLAGGVSLLALSGCAGLHPGYAARVGDTTISRSHVDDITRIRCDLASEAQGGVPQAVPRSTVQQGTVNVLVQSAIDNAYGASRHASYDNATLQAQVQQYTDSLTGLSAKDKARIVAEFRSSVKGALMLANVGATSLQAGGTAKPTVEASIGEGSKLAAAWAKKHLAVEIDPRFDPGTSGQAGGGDGSISRPVSSYATSTAGKPAAAFVNSLPAAQRCG